MLQTSVRMVEALLRARTRGELLDAVCRIAASTPLALAWAGLLEAEPDTTGSAQGHTIARHGPAADLLDSGLGAQNSGTAAPLAGNQRLPSAPVIHRDLQRAPADLPLRDQARERGLRAHAAFPLLCAGEPVGALHCYAADPGVFDGERLDLLERLASSASLALELHGARPAAPARHALTERMRTEQALAESEARLQHAQALALVGSWKLEGERIAWNEQTYRIFGVPVGQEITYQDFLSYVHPEDRELTNMAWWAAEQGQPYDIEHRIITGDGDVRWVREKAEVTFDEAGNPVVAVGMVQDITDRKRTLETLTRTNRMLQTLGRAQSRYIITGDLRTTLEEMLDILRELTDSEYGFIGEVLYTSEGQPYFKGYAITNIAWNQETQRFYREHYLNGLEFSNLDTLYGAVLTTREVVIANDAPNDPRAGGLPHGHPPLHAFLGVPLSDGGKLLGMVGIANRPAGYDQALVDHLESFLATCASLIAAQRNERRRKHAEEELRTLNAELEQRVAARTADIERANQELESFTYSVSHDLKSPLRAIDGYSTLLLRDHAGQLDEQGQRYLQRARRATQNMGKLIDDLLAYSRLDRRALSATPLDPRALVGDMLTERAQEIAERGVAVHVDIPELAVAADRDGLAMALRNLLENALKFTRDVPSPCIRLGGHQTDTTSVLWMRDNGCGFDMQYHDRIFDIFQRLHRAEEYQGTGVGLALVRRAMERMGGRAWAESQPGQGATFYLEIPRPARPE